VQISSRKVMQQVLLQNGVPPEAFSPVCVIVDKVDKIGREKVGAAKHAARHAACKQQPGHASELEPSDVAPLGACSCIRWQPSSRRSTSAARRSTPSLTSYSSATWQTSAACWERTARCAAAVAVKEAALSPISLAVLSSSCTGPGYMSVCQRYLHLLVSCACRMYASRSRCCDPPQVAEELQQLFRLLKAYGCGDWIVFDASIMRGLAYYTGGCATAGQPILLVSMNDAHASKYGSVAHASTAAMHMWTAATMTSCRP
jgi:hypothetical protein